MLLCPDCGAESGGTKGRGQKVRTRRCKSCAKKHEEGKNDPICSAAREFLYECPGGMDENKMRDKFLAAAKRDEKKGLPLYNIIENVVRAAFFQGQAVGKQAKPKTPGR